MCQIETSVDEQVTTARRVGLSGVIVYSGRHVKLKCTVWDLSVGGARLLLEGSVAAPERFALVLQTAVSDEEIPCEVVWRRGREVGVRCLRPALAAEIRRTPMTAQ